MRYSSFIYLVGHMYIIASYFQTSIFGFVALLMVGLIHFILALSTSHVEFRMERRRREAEFEKYLDIITRLDYIKESTITKKKKR